MGDAVRISEAPESFSTGAMHRRDWTEDFLLLRARGAADTAPARSPARRDRNGPALDDQPGCDTCGEMKQGRPRSRRRALDASPEPVSPCIALPSSGGASTRPKRRGRLAWLRHGNDHCVRQCDDLRRWARLQSLQREYVHRGRVAGHFESDLHDRSDRQIDRVGSS